MKKITKLIPLLILVGCQDSDIKTAPRIVNQTPMVFYEPIEASSESNQEILPAIANQISSSPQAGLFSFDITQTKRVSFRGTTIIGLVTPLHDNTSDEVNLINYIDAKGEPVESKIINRIIKTGNVYNNSYYTINGELIFRTSVENGIIRYQKKEPFNSAKVQGPGWGACVGAVLTQMADGSVIGSSAAIACFYFGGYCAASIGIGCIAYMF